MKNKNFNKGFLENFVLPTLTKTVGAKRCAIPNILSFPRPALARTFFPDKALCYKGGM